MLMLLIVMMMLQQYVVVQVCLLSHTVQLDTDTQQHNQTHMMLLVGTSVIGCRSASAVQLHTPDASQ